MHHAVYSSTKLHAGLGTVCCLLSSVCCLLFVYCPSTLRLLSVYCLSTFHVTSQTFHSPSLRCTDAAIACSLLLGHSKKKQQRMPFKEAAHAIGRTTAWVVYLVVCQSPACHALAGCSASAVPRHPESPPQPSALGSTPSPAVNLVSSSTACTKGMNGMGDKGKEWQEEEEREENEAFDCCAYI